MRVEFVKKLQTTRKKTVNYRQQIINERNQQEFQNKFKRT